MRYLVARSVCPLWCKIAAAVLSLTISPQAAGQAHWGYEGDESPRHWADLDPAYALCRTGREQSPVDLRDAISITGAGIQRQRGAAILTALQRAHVMDLIDNGHTVQVTNDVPMTATLDDVTYELVQFHFHAPSEHTVNGEHAPLEVHFVHKSEDGELAVIGILVEEGAPNALWDAVIAALPEPGGSRHVENLDIDMKQLRPLPQRYYRYRGSLTTPPCSEGVQWVIMADKRQISAQQMAQVVSYLHDNNRPVQPLGTRKIGYVGR